MGNNLKKTMARNKSIALLLFLFGYNNLFAGTGSYCTLAERQKQRITYLNNQDWCFYYNSYSYMNKSSNAYLSLKIPELRKDYFYYPSHASFDRVERSIPMLIEFDGKYLNPRKEDSNYYQASSKFKEKIIQANPAKQKRNCFYFASDSQYRFPVPAITSDLRVIIYYDIVKDKEDYEFIKKYGSFAKLDRYYEHRSLLLSDFTFEKGKEYELKVEVNPEVTIPDVDEHIPPNLNGFTITLKELPANTKFAFDGKDDIGKTYEQVKKEFFLYDKGAEGN